MQWYSFALMAAAAVSTRDAWVKRHFSLLGPYDMAMYPLACSVPLFGLSYFFVAKPALDSTFWLCILTGIPLEIIATLLYMESIRVSPLSLTVPYLALTPAFTLLTGQLLLHEAPNTIGMMGILATVVGSYVLNLNPNDRRLIAPFLGMLREKGCGFMLIVAVIYSMTSVISRKAILHSTPIFFGIVYNLILAASMISIIMVSGKLSSGRIQHAVPKGFMAGLLFFFEVICNNMAFASTQAAYVISVKRLSILMGVIYGGCLFREKQLLFRLAGASIMASGAIVISLWGK